MAETLLPRIARFARRRYKAIFAVTGILIVLAGLMASRLRFDPDFLNLLPQDAPEIQTFRRSLDEFGSVDYLLVAMRIPEGALIEPYEALASRLGERMTELPELTTVQYKLDDMEQLLATFMPQAMLFLDDAGRQAVLAKVTDERLELRARELRRLIATPQALSLKRLVLLDPLGISDVFLDRLGTARVGLSLDWASGFLLSRDQRMLLILAKPGRPPQDVEFNKRLVQAVRDQIAALKPEWPDISSNADVGFPEIALGGRYLVALGDEALIRQDAITNFVTSMVGVLVLFLFAFRRLGVLAYAFVPLFTGLVMTFAFSAVAFGVLNSATSGVAALLIGLGIDFIIVSYGRFVEERRRGVDFDLALARMNGSSGRAVVVGAVTSAATFYAFAVTDFTGLSQMGILAGTGILLCMVAVLFLLPALLAWSHDRHQRRRSDQRLFLHDLGSTSLIRLALGNPRWFLAVGLLVTIASGWLAFGLRFEDSVKAMRPAGNAGSEVWEEVARRFGSGFDQMSFIISSPELDEVLELAHEASLEAAKLVAQGVINDFDGLDKVIPPPSRQVAALEWLERERGAGLDMERIRATFGAALTAAGMRSEPFEHGLDLFSDAVARRQPIGLGDFRESAQASRLLDRYLVETADGWRSAVYLYPPPKVWGRRAPPEALAAVQRLGPRVELTGANVVSAFLRQRVLEDARLAALLGFAFVGILLWLDFRNLRDTVLALAPLLIGILWMLGGMAVFDIAMNFMNIFVTTMIIGIGVDYGVHMLHRYRELRGSRRADYIEGLSETGKAIVLAALSTTVGFGSLSLSHYPGLQSMGKVAILGAVCTCLVAITVLPAYLSLRIARHEREHRGAN
jgi:predicted RND superfamily exporter protein